MATAQELLVDAFMTRTAIAGCQMSADRRIRDDRPSADPGRLMAVQAIDALPCMNRHLVFMHHRVLQSRMTLGAFSRGAYKIGGWLRLFRRRTRTVHQKADTMSAKAITTARNTDRNDMLWTPGELAVCRDARYSTRKQDSGETLTGSPTGRHQREERGDARLGYSIGFWTSV